MNRQQQGWMVLVITALLTICLIGIAVAETEGLGWQKRYPEKP
jgi:hypothetical protein